MKKIFTLFSIIFFICMDVSYSQNFRIPIQVIDGCDNSITIWLGVDPAGTSGFDPGLDTLAPPPPPGGFDARYRWNGEDYFTDVRDNAITEKQFQMIYQKDAACAPLKLYWDKSLLSTLGTFFMVDNITGTLWGPIDMKTTDSLIITADSVYIQNSLRILVTPSSGIIAPDPPSNLVATTVSQTQINLSWTDNSDNEDGFKIERKLGASGTWSEIATVSSNVTAYQNTGLTANTNYCYQVRAYNVGGNSDYSNESCSTTLPNPPVAPTGLSVTTVSQTQINLSWTDNSDNEDGFKIERKLGPSGTWSEIATVGSNVTAYQNTGLTANTNYCYQVRAYNTGGNSDYSNESCSTTLPNPPAAPSNLTAGALNQTQINLAWVDNSNNEDGFKIERRVPPSITWTEIAIVGANVTTYSNTGLMPNMTYCYQVRAYNSGGNSAYSNEVCAITYPEIPDPPTILTAIGNIVNEVSLNWTDNSTNESGFIIERKLASLIDYTILDSVASNITSYIDSTVTQGVSYNYRVNAFNISGQSAYSNAIFVTTLLPAPTNLSAQLNSGESYSVTLNWTDNSANELGFVVERDVEGSGNFLVLDTVMSNVTGYLDTTLIIPIDTFYYRVFSFTADTVSDYSNIAELIIPVELTSFTARVYEKSVILNWTTSTELNNKGFEIERKLNANWETLAFIDGKGTTVNESKYEYVDDFNDKAYAGSAVYRLKQIDYTGGYVYSDFIEVSIDFTPKEFLLHQNYPNPFNPRTKIKYTLPYQSKVILSVYNALGEVVTTLVDGIQDKGLYEVEFDTSNLGSGIYFYRLETDNFVATKKMVLVK